MAFAIVATLFDDRVLSYQWIALGSLIGGVVGAIGARKREDDRDAADGGALQRRRRRRGGAGRARRLPRHGQPARPVAAKIIVSILFSSVVGSVSFAGSMIAFGKLQEAIDRIARSPARAARHHGGARGASCSCSAHRRRAIETMAARRDIGISLILGVAMVLPIGGADMPVVISLLNAFTGLATASTGFVLSNNVLIIAGMLVGASGTLLTMMMGKAMNRSIGNVVFGAFGRPARAPPRSAEGPWTAPVRATTAEDVAVMLAYAHRVVIVPGYGLAVAQAQHDVRELGDLLEKRGVDVRYAIHPVAGRMPGHMNVLLAEADVPYDAAVRDGRRSTRSSHAPTSRS